MATQRRIQEAYLIIMIFSLVLPTMVISFPHIPALGVLCGQIRRIRRNMDIELLQGKSFAVNGL